MDPQQALQIIDQAIAQVPGTRQQHQVLSEAIQSLAQAVSTNDVLMQRIREYEEANPEKKDKDR